MKMNIVIGAVARDDKADRTGVQAGRVVRIGVAEGNELRELLPMLPRPAEAPSVSLSLGLRNANSQ